MDECILELIKYKEYMDNAFSKKLDFSIYGKVPKFRYNTFKYCFEYFISNNLKTIVELGTSRSFVDGKYEGCMVNNKKYWDPNNPSKWDWGAGCFTLIASNCLNNYYKKFYTVDINRLSLNICKTITNNNPNINYINTSSYRYLIQCRSNSIDFLYLDTGDITPIEKFALLHLNEAKIIVRRNLISKNGIILIARLIIKKPKKLFIKGNKHHFYYF